MGTPSTSRRDLLKKSAVAGAVVWAAPTVTATPAFAAGSLSTNLCPGSITSITYRWDYTGAASTTWSVCENPGGLPNNGNAAISGQAPLSGPVTVSAYSFNNNKQFPLTPSPSTINVGDSFTLSGKLAPNTRVTLSNGYYMQYHLSCSDALCFGDKHGAFTVVSYSVA